MPKKSTYEDEFDDAMDAAELTARRLEQDIIRRSARLETLTALTGLDADEEFCDQVEEMVKAWEKKGAAK